MLNAIGIIFGNTSSNILQGLALEKPIAAVPFGGRYRLLDFALSSMVNSGIKTVGLVTSEHLRPMLDHLGSRKDWFLDLKSGGLFFLPGATSGLMSNGKFRVKDLKLNIEFLHKDFSKHVVISTCNQVFNVNYSELINFQEETEADITLVYQETNNPVDLQGRVCLDIENSQRVYKMQKNFKTEDKETCQSFVDIMVIRRKLLLEIIEGYKNMETVDLLDVIQENLSFLRVYAFQYEAYIGKINSIKDYFERSMDLLKPETREELLMGKDPIHTKIIDNPPTKYGSHSNVSNSLIASGCFINGEVQNSILSREVIVNEGCKIKNSIIMQKCIIGPHSVLENVILDSNIEIHEGNVLKGNLNNPLVIYKKAVD